MYMDAVKKWFSFLYVQYEIVTCSDMLEPWERLLINAVIFSSLFLLIFSSYVFLPNYVFNLLWMFVLTSHQTETGFKQINQATA